MSDKEKHVLTLVEKGYTIKEIKEQIELEKKELLATLVILFKYQIDSKTLENSKSINMLTKLLSGMNELIEFETIDSAFGKKQIYKCEKAICSIDTDINESHKEVIDSIKHDLKILRLKVTDDKRKRIFDPRYQKIDEIFFQTYNLEKAKIIIKDKDFNIYYASDIHLFHFLVEEYVDALKKENNNVETNYYRDLMDCILVNPKLKIKFDDKQFLISEIIKNVEKIKRSRNCKSKKIMMNHLNLLLDKLKNKDAILFKTKTDKSFNGNRRNLTNDYTITIDNPETKVYDDALSMKPLKNGNYLLGIHIADANAMTNYKLSFNNKFIEEVRVDEHNLQTNGSIFKRTPAAKALTLRAKQPRPTNSLLVEITSKGEVINFEFVKGIIKVDENLSFTDIGKKLKNKNDSAYSTVENLIQISSALRSKNQTKEIYSGLKILSRDARPLNSGVIDISNLQFDYGRMVIQESMILYNHLMSTYFVDMGYPFIYKNREGTPDICQNVDEVNKVINMLKKKKYPSNKIVAALISLYPETEYSTTNKGNSALQLPSYCNSTSPLRYTNDKVAALSLDKCYYKKPKDKDIYEMEEVFPILCKIMNKSSKQELDNDVKTMSKEIKGYLNNSRKC